MSFNNRHKKTIADIKLSPERKNEMRDNLSVYANARPAVEPSPYFAFVSKISSAKRVAGAVFVAVLMIVGGTFSISKAEPEDALYGVKVHVFEEVYAALLTNPSNDAEWNIERSSKRLAEAVKMIREGDHSPSALSAVKKNFRAHAAEVQQSIQSFDDEATYIEAAEISSKFASTLSVYESVLAQLAADDESNAEEMTSLGTDVYKEKQAAESAHSEAVNSMVASTNTDKTSEDRDVDSEQGGTTDEDDSIASTTPPRASSTPSSATSTEEVDAHATGTELIIENGFKGTSSSAVASDLRTDAFPKPATEKMKKSATQQIKRMRELSDDIDADLDNEVREHLRDELDKVGLRIDEADELFDAGSYGQAFVLYQKAFNNLDKVALYIKADTDLGLDILPGLIPLLGSDFSAVEASTIDPENMASSTEPKDAKDVEELLNVIDKKVKQLEETVRMESLTPSQSFKVGVQIRTVKTLLVRADIVLQSNASSVAYTLAKEAERLADETEVEIAKWQSENQEASVKDVKAEPPATSTAPIAPQAGTSTATTSPSTSGTENPTSTQSVSGE